MYFVDSKISYTVLVEDKTVTDFKLLEEIFGDLFCDGKNEYTDYGTYYIPVCNCAVMKYSFNKVGNQISLSVSDIECLRPPGHILNLKGMVITYFDKNTSKYELASILIYDDQKEV